MNVMQQINTGFSIESHTVTDNKTSRILRRVNRCIQNALLEEIYTTPKPGLVDRLDTGSHNDMDVSTFEISITAITPYIMKMFKMGLQWKGQLKELFLSVRGIGRTAEEAMLQATGGVNTHKGAVFSMGLLAASAGYQYGREGTFLAEKILNLTKEMSSEILERDFQKMRIENPVSHGEFLYKKYGEKGIRGEAMAGYPILRDVAMPWIRWYRSGVCKTFGKTDQMILQNMRNLNVLLHIISNLSDTNVLIRSNRSKMLWLQQQSREILAIGGAFSSQGMNRICRLNKDCIQDHISPGGAADMLAAAIFLWNLEQINIS